MKYMFILFKSLHYFYLFDGNVNKILRINEKTFQALRQVVDESINEENTSILLRLQQLGFCKESNVKTIKHPETDFLSSYFDNMLGGLTLQVTQSCNLRCSYCPYSSSLYNNRNHNSRSMSFKLACKAIDYYLLHSRNTKRLRIGFYGGEPLLELALIKKVVSYIKYNYPNKKISYLITTNGTLLYGDAVDFLIDNEFSITVSLDGPEHYHNQNRSFSNGTGSFKIIKKNLMYIKEYYPEYYSTITFNSVIIPDINYDIYSEFFSMQDFTKDNVYMLATMSPNYTDEKIVYPRDYYLSGAHQRFSGMLWSIGAIQSNNISDLTKRWIDVIVEKQREIQNMGTLSHESHPGGPCIPGKDKLFVDVNGDFYPCERVSEKSSIMKMGNVYNGVDIEKVETLVNIAKCSENTCISCWCFSFCTLCAAYVDDLSPQPSATMRLSNCHEVKSVFLDTLKDICFLSENNYDFQKRILQYE